jgi:tetratricopeptide (TPR) repeat protein
MSAGRPTPGGALAPADAARLAQAFQLLQRGQAERAAGIAQEVAARSPEAPEPQHLLALCRKAVGDSPGAAAAFEAALGRAPRDAVLLGNYANLLGQMNRLSEAIAHYRRSLELAPGHGPTWMNLGLALSRAGDPRGACAALDRAVGLLPNASPAWQALGSARRAAGDLEAAEAALRRAVALDAGNGAAWTNLGVVRRLLADPAEALECYGRARQAGFSGPELDDAEASAQLDLGEPGKALEIARRLTGTRPDYVPGHAMLAQLLWEHGSVLAPDADPIAVFRSAVDAQPANRALRMAFIRFLLEADSAEEALAQIRALRQAGDEPALVALEANALEMLGRGQAAGEFFARAYPAMRRDAGFLNLYVRHLLRARRPGEAADRALEALESEPGNQLSLAYPRGRLALAGRSAGGVAVRLRDVGVRGPRRAAARLRRL